MLSVLLPLAASFGGPLLKKLVAGKFGDRTADIVEQVVDSIAEKLGKSPEEFEDVPLEP